MKKFSIALVAAACVLSLALPAQAKKPAKKPAGEQQQEGGDGAVPRYQPFPHNQNFVLKDVNGKAPSAEIWIRFDSTDRASGFSGCKNWSGVFIIGSNRLGPRAMPAFTEQTCDAAMQAFEREYWGILLNGPYWDTQGDDLIIKGVKGGVLRFQRSL